MDGPGWNNLIAKPAKQNVPLNVHFRPGTEARLTALKEPLEFYGTAFAITHNLQRVSSGVTQMHCNQLAHSVVNVFKTVSD